MSRLPRVLAVVGAIIVVLRIGRAARSQGGGPRATNALGSSVLVWSRPARTRRRVAGRAAAGGVAGGRTAGIPSSIGAVAGGTAPELQRRSRRSCAPTGGRLPLLRLQPRGSNAPSRHGRTEAVLLSPHELRVVRRGYPGSCGMAARDFGVTFGPQRCTPPNHRSKPRAARSPRRGGGVSRRRSATLYPQRLATPGEPLQLQMLRLESPGLSCRAP
jgi:hypothetical protein